MSTLGVTATRQGLTVHQRMSAQNLLELRRELGADTLHHGAAIGGDEELAELAHALGYRLEAHPSTIRGQVSQRALTISHVVRPAKPPLDRNRDIVDAADVCLIACPNGPVEELRSGTWMTVRYARRDPTLARLLVHPDGSVHLDAA